MQWGRFKSVAVRLTVSTAAVLAIMAGLDALPLRDRPFSAGMLFLLAVLMVAVAWGHWYAVFAAVLAGLAFSRLAPPHRRFWISDSRDLHALAQFLVVGLIGSYLAARARREAASANQRHAEALAAQERFAALVDSVEGIVWEADARTFAFSFVSKQAERILGYPTEQWLREPEFWKDHLHPDDRERTVSSCCSAIASARNHELEYRMIAAGGRVVWLHDIVSVAVEDGRPSRVRGVKIDITGRKEADEERDRLRRLEAELARVNRVATIGELTASLAHEVNQPITAAITSASAALRWLGRAEPDVERAREAAAATAHEASHAGEIVSRIRALFRKGSPVREPVDVNDLVGQIVELIRPEAMRQGVSLRTELAADVPCIMGDRVQLQQVLLNLAVNGIEAMKDVDGQRQITITSRRDDGGQLLVAVADTGPGLPPDAGDIFNAFFTTKPDGTGMGLAISRSIIESHRGTLWGAPNHGRGAVFSFRLPTADGAARSASTPV